MISGKEDWLLKKAGGGARGAQTLAEVVDAVHGADQWCLSATTEAALVPPRPPAPR